MDEFARGLLAAIAVLAAAGLAWWCKKRYEIAIFLVALSPLVSAVFLPSTVDMDIDAASEPGTGA